MSRLVEVPSAIVECFVCQMTEKELSLPASRSFDYEGDTSSDFLVPLLVTLLSCNDIDMSIAVCGG